jgi:zinc transporter, ZIP family
VAELSLSDAAWIVGSGAGTALGGSILVAVHRPSPRMIAAFLGFTAGVMLAASSFSLLVPALERGSVLEVLAGLLVGAACLAALDEAVPHIHARFVEPGHELQGGISAHQRATLLLAALTLHNVPEGMAVGLAFAAGGPELGVPTALAIGIQNVPEGFAAAAPLLDTGASRRRAWSFAALTGSVEPPAAFLAVAATGLAGALMVGGLAFAAGAMIYVVVDELIPESHAGGHEREATLALIAGFALMLVLDNAFGA